MRRGPDNESDGTPWGKTRESSEIVTEAEVTKEAPRNIYLGSAHQVRFYLQTTVHV